MANLRRYVHADLMRRGGVRWGSQVSASVPGPDSISGLQLWLRADLGVTVSGSGVSLWEDQSGNGRDYEQGTDNRRPTVSSGGLGGQDALAFDPSSNPQHLTSASAFPALSSAYSIFAVYENRAVVNFGTIVDFESSNKAIRQSGSTGLTEWLQDASPLVIVTAAATSIDDAKYDFVTWDGSTAEYFENNSSEGTESSTDDMGSATAAIGARAAASLANNMLFAELAVYDNDIGSAGRATLSAYASARYGL